MKSQNMHHLSKKCLLKALLLGLTTAIILSGCTGLTGGLSDSKLLITSTPTFELPGPDDEDPIADCLLDSPLCIVETSVEGFEGRPYLAASIAIDLENPPFNEPDDELVLDADVAVTEGTNVDIITEVRGHTIVMAPPEFDFTIPPDLWGFPDGVVFGSCDESSWTFDPNYWLYCSDQTPDDDVWFFDECFWHGILCPGDQVPGSPEDHPTYSFDFDSGDILIYYIETDILIRVNNTSQQLIINGDDFGGSMSFGEIAFDSPDLEDPGIILYDGDGNPIATLVSSDGVLTVFESNGAPIANIGLIGPNYIAFTDSDGNPVTSLSLQDGKVFIDMGLGGEPIAIITPIKAGVGGVEEGKAILLTTFIPLSGWVNEVVDLSGTVEVYVKDTAGVRHDLDKVPLTIVSVDFTKYAKVEEGEPAKVPTSAPSKSQPTKQSPSKENPDPVPTKDTSKKNP
jgi:hypothetical protein